MDMRSPGFWSNELVSAHPGFDDGTGVPLARIAWLEAKRRGILQILIVYDYRLTLSLGG